MVDDSPVPAGADDPIELRPDGSRWEQRISDGLLGVGSAILPWLFGDVPRWIAGLVSLLGVAWVVIAFVRAHDYRLLLAADGLVVERKGSRSTIRFDQIREVRTEWVLEGPATCHITARSGRKVEMRLTSDSEAFLAELGARLEPFRHQVHAKPSACDLLGWDRRPTQLD